MVLVQMKQFFYRYSLSIFSFLLWGVFLSLLVHYNVFFVKKSQKILSSPIKERDVAFQAFYKTKHVLEVDLWATAESSRKKTFISPVKGVVRAIENRQVGNFIKKGESLAFVDSNVAMDAYKKEQLNLEAKELEYLQALRKQKSLESKLSYLQAKLDLQKESASIKEDKMALQSSLYAKTQALYEGGVIPEKTYLQGKKLFLQEEIEYKNALILLETQSLSVEEAKDAIKEVEHRISYLKIQKKALQVKLQSLIQDLEEAICKLPFSSFVEDIFVHEGQNIQEGQTIAKVVALDKVIWKVDLPDNYLRFLEGNPIWDLSQGSSKHTGLVKVEQIAPSYSKNYQGAYIQEIGRHFNPKNRSLRLTLAYDTPITKEGKLDQNLLIYPGAYCRLTIPLRELRDVFVIPSKALQEGDYLYACVKSQNDKWSLKAHKADILARDKEQLIVKIDTEDEKINLIPYPFLNASDGMSLSLKVVNTQKENTM